MSLSEDALRNREVWTKANAEYTDRQADEGTIDERLARSYFELGRIVWPGEGEGVEWHLGHGDMLRLLRDTGFEVEGLWELRAPESAADHEYYDFVPADWARKWPSEEIWKARKR